MAVEPIAFYRAVGEYGFLSNLWPCTVVFPWPAQWDSKAFPSAEHAYQYGKPRDPDLADWLVACRKPDVVATTAHALPRYRVREDWGDVKVARMREVVRAKFGQNDDLRGRLLATGDALLVEASRTDRFWGAGQKGDGQNTLGLLLMELRQALRGP